MKELLFVLVFVIMAHNNCFSQCPNSGKCRQRCNNSSQKNLQTNPSTELIDNFLLNLYFIDSVTGNANGLMNIGESIEFVGKIRSNFTSAIDSVACQISCSNPALAIDSPQNHFLGTMLPMDLIEIVWTAAVSDTLAPNSINQFTVQMIVTAEGGYQQTITMFYEVGCQYCSLYSFNCQDGDGFTDFFLAEIQNPGNGCGNDGYSNFTDKVCFLSAGQSYTVSWATGFQNNFADLYIDLDENCDMYAEDELLINNYPLSLNLSDATLVIPPTATPGVKLLRIVACYQMDPSCYGNSGCVYGEIEDYTVIITKDELPSIPEFSVECSGVCNEMTWQHPVGWSSGLTYFVFRDNTLLNPEGTESLHYCDTITQIGRFYYCVQGFSDTLSTPRACAVFDMTYFSPQNLTYLCLPGGVQISWSPPDVPLEPTYYELYKDGELLAGPISDTSFFELMSDPGIWEYHVKAYYEEEASENSDVLLLHYGICPENVPFSEGFDAGVKPDNWFCKTFPSNNNLIFFSTYFQVNGAQIDDSCVVINSTLDGQRATVVTPPMNCSDAQNVHLSFTSYVAYNYSTIHKLLVSNDGFNWQEMGALFQDWKTGHPAQIYIYDISSIADNKELVLVKWEYSGSNVGANNPEWLIDNVVVEEGASELPDSPGDIGIAFYFNNAAQRKIEWCPSQDATSYNIYNNGLLMFENIRQSSHTFTTGQGSMNISVTGNTDSGESNGPNLFYLPNIGFPPYYSTDTLHYNLHSCEVITDSIPNATQASSSLVQFSYRSCTPLEPGVPIPPTTNNYCKPITNPGPMHFIQKFQLGEANLTGGYSASGYSYMNDEQIVLTAGKSYFGTMYLMPVGNYVRIWLDVDRDIVFEEDELIFSYSCQEHHLMPLVIHIPDQIQVGQSMLRVRVSDQEIFGPCDENGSGEIEDYPVWISDTATQYSWFCPFKGRWSWNSGDEYIKFIIDARQLQVGEYLGYFYVEDWNQWWVDGFMPVKLEVTTTNPPKNLTALANPFSGIDVMLSWLPPEGPFPDGYNIYRNGFLINVDLITNLNYLDSCLQPGTYAYHVYAVFGECESSPSNEAVVNILVGVNESDNTHEFRIFPNPASGKVTIFKPESVDCYDVQIISQWGVVSSKKQVTTRQQIIDVGSYPVGIFIVQIITEDEIIFEKLIIE
nr:T9SS type A sorting domain-containing protein [Bacteroidota bacterium]